MIFNSRLESLRLEGCNICDDPIIETCKLLPGHKIVPTLDIKWNNITDTGMLALLAVEHGTIDARNNKLQQQPDYVAHLGHSDDHYDS